ncbi:MAG: hypothetical protein PVJ07_03055 [Anaerolineales bacterium]
MLRPTGGWGYNSDTEIIFPMRVASQLRSARGQRWQRLVDQVLASREGSEERLGFSLLFVRLSGCLTCHADSYRAMRGCTLCAKQTVRRFRGDDSELIALYECALGDVERLKSEAGDVRKELVEG